MSDTDWQLVVNPLTGETDTVSRTLANGFVEACSLLADEYVAWRSAGGVPLPAVTAPAPVPSCTLWQLQSVMTTAQWVQLQAAITALNNAAVVAFFAHGTSVIPANSTTLISLGATIDLTADQITALVAAAAAVSIP